MTLTASEKAELARQNAQCLLVNNLPDVLRMSSVAAGFGLKGFKINGRPEPTQQTIVYAGKPDRLVNALTTDLSPPAEFVHATPAQLSQLQPRLDFYIRSNVSPDPQQTPVPTDRKIIFSDYVKGERMTQLQNARNSGEMLNPNAGNLHPSEGWNVGLKEFTWTFDNKHEGDKIVKAKLVMYFGSLIELTNQYYLDFLFTSGRVDPASSGSSNESHRQKLQRIEKELKDRKKVLDQLAQGNNRKYKNLRKTATMRRDARQLKVIVGWAAPENNKQKIYELFDDKRKADAFYKAVEDSQKTLLLNLTQYDINFNQNGSVEVTLEYIASSDAFIVSPKADILADHGDPNRGLRSGFVPTGRGFFGGNGKLDNYMPGGYLHSSLKSAIETSRTQTVNGIDVWSVRGEYVLAEVEYLAEYNEFLALKYGNNRNPGPVQHKEIRKFKKYEEAALAAYDDYLASAQANKYKEFLNKLILSGRCWEAVAELKDIAPVTNQRVAPPKYLKLKPFAAGTVARRIQGNTQTGASVLAFKTLNDLADAIDQAKIAGVTAQEYLDGDENRIGVLNPQANDTNRYPSAAAATDRTIIFTRLGDIIQTASDSAMIPPTTQLILGSFSPREARMRGFKDGDIVSLAELPIALDYFGQWFFDHVISLDIDVYPFRRFLDDIINDLVNPILNELCSPVNTKLAAAYTNYTVSQKLMDNNSALTTSPRVAGDWLAKEVQKASQKAAKAGFNDKLITLILIHAEQVNDLRSGNRITDEKDGIYHFILGTDRGIVKEFNFSQKQMPHLRAMNIEKINTGASKAGVLILPMDVSLRMFGNALLRNGSMIYVNADYGVGTAVADSLKLGGYYRVYKSSNTIRPGFFETTVDCIFERPRVNPSPKASDT
tara:strand:- start:4475 stop:7132 length:2658 start_codon:yes stop_codon:yes gene_type:complete